LEPIFAVITLESVPTGICFEDINLFATMSPENCPPVAKIIPEIIALFAINVPDLVS
jgi:hypothetical protein